MNLPLPVSDRPRCEECGHAMQKHGAAGCFNKDLVAVCNCQHTPWREIESLRAELQRKEEESKLLRGTIEELHMSIDRLGKRTVPDGAEERVKMSMRITELEQAITAAHARLGAYKDEIGRLNEEIGRRDEDRRIAAGECLVQIPEPGTDAARLLIANKLARQEIDRLDAENRSSAVDLRLAWDRYACPAHPPKECKNCEFWESIYQRHQLENVAAEEADRERMSV